MASGHLRRPAAGRGIPRPIVFVSPVGPLGQLAVQAAQERQKLLLGGECVATCCGNGRAYCTTSLQPAGIVANQAWSLTGGRRSERIVFSRGGRSWPALRSVPQGRPYYLAHGRGDRRACQGHGAHQRHLAPDLLTLPRRYRLTSAAAFLARPIRLVTASSNGYRVHDQPIRTQDGRAPLTSEHNDQMFRPSAGSPNTATACEGGSAW